MMTYISRRADVVVAAALRRHKSVLVLGPRQTGKTTLLSRLPGALSVSFAPPAVRQRYERDLALLTGEVERLPGVGSGKRPLVLLDEVQKVPQILDAVQDLIDRHRALFVLTGSSARSLRHRSRVNLLPGRVLVLRLDPLMVHEVPDRRLSDWLLYGALPGMLPIHLAHEREAELTSYVTTYVEEEVRAEAVVRNIGAFSRFLELAASESGHVVNLSRLSQDIGVSHVTIAGYYQILEDCLIGERVEPLTVSSTRRKLTRGQKYLFFDLGVRRVAAGEGAPLPKEVLGHAFEQFIGLELLRGARLAPQRTRVRFWRDPAGPEVDWVIERAQVLTPVEVKWTASPGPGDIKHLRTFLKEYRNTTQGYVVCQVPREVRLDHRIIAIPWQQVDRLVLS